MSQIQETLFDLLVNALLQIGVFAIVAAVFSRLVAKARAKHQYSFYLIVFCSAWQLPLSIQFGNRAQPLSKRNCSSRFPWALEWRITIFGIGRWRPGISRSHWRPGSKVGSSVSGECLSCCGWSASAELFIEFIGCGETRLCSHLPRLGWPAMSSRPNVGSLSLNLLPSTIQ